MTTFHHLQIKLKRDLISSRCSSRSLELYNRLLRGRGREGEGGREGERGREGEGWRERKGRKEGAREGGEKGGSAEGRSRKGGRENARKEGGREGEREVYNIILEEG